MIRWSALTDSFHQNLRFVYIAVEAVMDLKYINNINIITLIAFVNFYDKQNAADTFATIKIGNNKIPLIQQLQMWHPQMQMLHLIL